MHYFLFKTEKNSNSDFISSKMLTNMRGVKLWGNVHLKINTVLLLYLFYLVHWDAIGINGLVGEKAPEGWWAASRSPTAWARQRRSGCPGQLIKLTLWGFIILLLMPLPQAPITIYVQNDCQKTQLRGKNHRKPSTVVLPKFVWVQKIIWFNC
jgi:hypothetical protein